MDNEWKDVLLNGDYGYDTDYESDHITYRIYSNKDKTKVKITAAQSETRFWFEDLYEEVPKDVVIVEKEYNNLCELYKDLMINDTIKFKDSALTPGKNISIEDLRYTYKQHIGNCITPKNDKEYEELNDVFNHKVGKFIDDLFNEEL